MRPLNNISWGSTINVSPYACRPLIYDRPELGNRFYIFRWAFAHFPCPLIDPVLQQARLSIVTAAVLRCALFSFWCIILRPGFAITSCLSTGHQFPFPHCLRETEWILAVSCHYLLLLEVKGGVERCRKESEQGACNVQLRGLLKWRSSIRKKWCCDLIFKSVQQKDALSVTAAEQILFNTPSILTQLWMLFWDSYCT